MRSRQQQNGRKIQYNDVTICENDNSSVNSGTDGGNSDSGVLTDFSDDDEYLIDRANRLYVECYNDDWCEGMTPITYTLPLRKNRRRRYEVRKKNETEIEESISVTSDWGFQTDEESPKSEPTVQPRTVDDEDIPPVEDRIDNRGRRTRIGSDKDISSDTNSNLFDRPVTESATAWAGRYSHSDGEYWENFGRRMTDGMKILARDHGNITGDDYSFVVKQLARRTMRAWAEERARPVEQHAGCRIPDCQCDGRIEIMGHSGLINRPVVESVSARECKDTKFSSNDHLDKESDIVNRPVTESVVARSRSETDFSRDEHLYIVNRPVTEPMTARDGSDTNFPSSVHSDLVDRPVTESVTTRPETDIDFFGEEQSELVNRPITGSVTTRDGSGTDSPEEEHSLMVNRPGTELVTTRHGSDTDFFSSKHSDFADRLVMRSVSIWSGRNTHYDSKEQEF